LLDSLLQEIVKLIIVQCNGPREIESQEQGRSRATIQEETRKETTKLEEGEAFHCTKETTSY